jgi:hypothetical protein
VATHPYEVKLIRHARCKTDPIDARKLAARLQVDLLLERDHGDGPPPLHPNLNFRSLGGR